jgi:hypothetical protein
MPTNAQAALAAAATAVADRLKAWLDKQDAAETPPPDLREVSLDALVERADPPAAPELRIGFRARQD